MSREKMATFVGQEELPELQRKRAEAIAAAGKKWLLHPSNFVKRKPPTSKRPALFLLAFIVAISAFNPDCDGQCRQTTQVAP